MRSRITHGLGVGIIGLYLTVTTAPACLAQQCVGDCDGDGMVRINELITGVNIALGSAEISVCPAFDCPQPLPGIFIDCAVEAVNNALYGCHDTFPTPVTPSPASTCTLSATPSLTRTPTVTPTPTATRTCPPAPPPATCPAGEVIACTDQLCSVDCGCGTVTSTPTPTNTCTPGFNPPPGCRYEGDTPTLTLTPCNHEPTPTVPITYRLRDGSMILFTPPTSGGVPAVPEPLSGTFTVVESELVPNSFFAFNITGIDFRAEGFTVMNAASGGNTIRFGCLGQIGFGCVEASTLYPPPTALFALVSINGEENIELVGGGPRDSGNYPPALNDLELCGGPNDQPFCEGPYRLTLFAVPEN